MCLTQPLPHLSSPAPESLRTQTELPGRSDWGQPPEHKAAGAAGSIHCSRDLIYANSGASRPGTMECLNPLRQGEEESPRPHLTLVNAKLDPASKERRPF